VVAVVLGAIGEGNSDMLDREAMINAAIINPTKIQILSPGRFRKSSTNEHLLRLSVQHRCSRKCSPMNCKKFWASRLVDV
jgi:hypothetical protein